MSILRKCSIVGGDFLYEHVVMICGHWYLYLLLVVFVAAKESRVYVFRLSDFEGDENGEFVLGKQEIKDHKIERTKGKQNT